MALTSNQITHSKQRRGKLTKICEAFPKVEVEVAGEDHLAFRISRKIFAYYLFDHHGDGRIAFCCKSNLNDQRRLVREDPDSFFVPAYVGPKGWVAIRLDLDQVDWEIVEELARQAYQSIAPRRLAALIEDKE